MLKLAAAVGALVGTTAAHMAMIAPCARYNPNCPVAGALPPGKAVDYDIKNPIHSPDPKTVTQPLCKYPIPWARPVASWTAGQPITVSFQPGGGAHGGGHCQFSLSYDGGQTFAVVHEVLRHCFFNGPSSVNEADTLSYTFNLPADVPSSDKAIFSWTWVNAIGNREFYMNCADVTIKGTSPSYTGKKMTIANYPGYDTIPEFMGNYETGINMYTSAPNITVTGSGSSPVAAGGGGGYASAGGSTTTTTASDRQATTMLTPGSGSSSSNQGCATSSAPDCVGGEACGGGKTIRCASSGSGFQQCVNGSWLPEQPCGPGTKCIDNGTALYCG
ncbi:hypothetical protein H4R18_001885, partial [Coemansia javaensis]